MEKLDLKNGVLLISGLLFGFANSIAQVPGEIDNDWGFSGWISTDHVTNKGEVFHDMITLENDGFLMIGQTDSPDSDILLAKYNSDGTLNEDFGNNGVSKIDLSLGGNDLAFSAEILFDGKILLIGSTTTVNGIEIALVRLGENGGFDSSFGNNGVAQYSAGNNTWSFANNIKVLPDNSIIVGAYTLSNGDYNVSLLKFTQGGGLDLSFGDNGVFIFENLNTDDELTGMEVTDAGEIYTTWITDNGVNKAAILMKLDNTGALDNSFGSSGTDGITEYFVAAENYFNDLKIDENGKIIVVGHEGSGDDFAGIIIRYNADGLIDQSFATNGKITLDIGASDGILLNNLEIIQDGKMLASGNASGQTLKQVYAFMFDEAGNSVCDFSACSGMYASYTFAPVEYKGDLLALLSDGSILLGGHATSQDFVGEQMYVTKVFNVNQVADLSSQTVDESKISVYPNPTRSQFTIKLNKGEEIVETQLINPQGRTVQSWNEHATNFYLNGNIASGSYYIKVQTNKTVYTNNLTIK
ncbi:MAG: T9SS type A sorting domain-containing protein [Brumimicrobium sp.]